MSEDQKQDRENVSEEKNDGVSGTEKEKVTEAGTESASAEKKEKASEGKKDKSSGEKKKQATEGKKENASKGTKDKASEEEKDGVSEEKKVVTKYDLKVQRRQQEKAREAREKKVGTGILVAVLAVLVVFVLSFPIRSIITLNRTYISVDGEKITEVEYDYYYYTAMNNFVNTYSAYLSYFGLDLSGDLSQQPYSSTLSWKDHFDELAVDNIKLSKSLKADAEAAGFTYDITEDYERFVTQQQAAAETAGMSFGEYCKAAFGPYATLKRIKPYVEDALYVSAYHEKLSDDMIPGDEEIQSVYEENPASYDSVDYRILTFDAELPTEPTDLADPDAEPLEEGQTYTPSDAEVEKAMEDAKVLADEAVKTVKTKGDLMENIRRSGTSTVIREWLFDDARKAGDTVVLEDETNNRYYCLAFEKRYRDETATADVRIMVVPEEEEAQEIYETWSGGEATEDSFIALCDGEYYNYAVADGGLMEGITPTEDIYEELLDWIFAEGRTKGDCEVVTVPETASFVVYYIGEGRPQWFITIRNNLRSEALEEYTTALTEKCEVSDPAGNLNYIKVYEEEAAASAAAQESSEAAEGSSSAESESGESSSAE